MKKIITISLLVLTLNSVANWGNSWHGNKPINFNNNAPWGNSNFNNTSWNGNAWGGMPWNGNGLNNSSWGNGNTWGVSPWGNNNSFTPFRAHNNFNPFNNGNGQAFGLNAGATPREGNPNPNLFKPINSSPWNYGYNQEIPVTAETENNETLVSTENEDIKKE